MLCDDYIEELDRLLGQFAVRMDKGMRIMWSLSTVASQLI